MLTTRYEKLHNQLQKDSHDYQKRDIGLSYMKRIHHHITRSDDGLRLEKYRAIKIQAMAASPPDAKQFPALYAAFELKQLYLDLYNTEGFNKQHDLGKANLYTMLCCLTACLPACVLYCAELYMLPSDLEKNTILRLSEDLKNCCVEEGIAQESKGISLNKSSAEEKRQETQLQLQKQAIADELNKTITALNNAFVGCSKSVTSESQLKIKNILMSVANAHGISLVANPIFTAGSSTFFSVATQPTINENTRLLSSVPTERSAYGAT